MLERRVDEVEAERGRRPGDNGSFVAVERQVAHELDRPLQPRAAERWEEVRDEEDARHSVVKDGSAKPSG